MSRLQLVKHAIRLWSVPDVPKEINRSNTRKWIASVDRLGDKWLLYSTICPTQPEQQNSQPTLLDQWLLEKKINRLQ